MRSGRPAASRPVAICRRQPGLLETIDLGFGLQDVLHLAIAQFGCRLRLEQVVDACRPAADFRFGDLAHVNAGNRLQQAPRLSAHALRMLKVTGVVIGGLRTGTAPRGARGSSSASTSEMSLHLRRKRLGTFAAYAGSLRSRWPYRFIAEPHPAAFTTMVSTSACRTRRSGVLPRPSHLLLRPRARRARRSTPASEE